MRAIRSARLALALLLAAGAVHAQSAPTDYRDEFLEHFQRSTAKLVQLAEATFEDLFAWSPGPGVMSVERVYAHIARYNYLYLADNLGIPEGLVRYSVGIENAEDLVDDLARALEPAEG